MMVLSRRTQKLLAWWLVLTMTSILVNVYAQGSPLDCSKVYTDDPCTTTCMGCTKTEPTLILREMCCCRPDLGCKLNPFTSNSQVSLCRRRLHLCIVETGGEKIAYECCPEPEECFEVNGAPCCDPGKSTALCP
jgi:hypothetical protein